ncbi:MAG: hypothetical protein WCX46_04080 [Candidatus Paceibacterota bacterium]
MNSNEIYKELKKEQTALEYQIKKVEKLRKMYSSKFSDEQRLLSKTCPEGEVIKALRECIVNYVHSFVLEAVTVNHIVSEKPPHSSLLKYLNNFMKSIEEKRAKYVEKIIRLALDSLESHLEYTHKHTSEGTKFHKDCVVEYTEIINNAIKLW